MAIDRKAILAWFWARFTAGRGVVGAYVIVIVGLSLLVNENHAHYRAASNLPANTRLVADNLRAPPGLSVGGRLRLLHESALITGHYLTHDLRKGIPIGPDSVLPWPDLKEAPITPVQLKGEPDLRLLNSGANVEIAVGEAHKQARVQAVIVSKGKWFALFRQKDVGDTFKQTVKIVRILSLPDGSPAKGQQKPPNKSEPKAQPQQSSNENAPKPQTGK